jgi:hypothetical protein
MTTEVAAQSPSDECRPTPPQVLMVMNVDQV